MSLEQHSSDLSQPLSEGAMEFIMNDTFVGTFVSSSVLNCSQGSSGEDTVKTERQSLQDACDVLDGYNAHVECILEEEKAGVPIQCEALNLSFNELSQPERQDLLSLPERQLMLSMPEPVLMHEIEDERIPTMVVLQNSGSVTCTSSKLAENTASQIVPSSVKSFPATDTYRGQFEFDVSVESPVKITKSCNYTYSESLNKVYVKFATSCPFRVATSLLPTRHAFLRATPMFLKREDALEPVRRCVHHASLKEASNVNHPAPDHLLHCQETRCSPLYDQDPDTGFHSVVVACEQTPTKFQNIWYSFGCYSSCIGGLGRRPIQVVFTLERTSDGEILGRRALEVRICACPGRDMKTEERTGGPRSTEPSAVASGYTGVKEKGRTDEPVDSSLVRPSLKRALERDEEETFTVKVRGRENFAVVSHITRALELTSRMEGNRTDVASTIGRSGQVSNVSTPSLPSGTRFWSMLEDRAVPGETQRNVELPREDFVSSSNRCDTPRLVAADPESRMMNWDLERFLNSVGVGEFLEPLRRQGITDISKLIDMSLGELRDFGMSVEQRFVLCRAIILIQSGLSST